MSTDDNEYPPRPLPSLNGGGEPRDAGDLDLPGVAKILHELRDPVEVELRLLRQAYKEHGLAIGQMQMTFERSMEAVMDRLERLCREVKNIQFACKACDPE